MTQPLSIVRPSEFLAQSTDGVMTVTGLARSVFSGVLDGPSQLPVEVRTRIIQELVVSPQILLLPDIYNLK